MLPCILIFGLLFCFGILSKLQESNQKAVILIAIYAVSILYYWRVVHHMSDVASGNIRKDDLSNQGKGKGD
jgi:hypothetical protein